MKTIILLIFFQFLFLFTFCQVDSTSINILETILRQQQPKGTIYYTDKLDSELILKMKRSLKGRRFIARTSENTNDTISLTRSEKKHLDSSLSRLYVNLWKDSLFKDSKRIPKDSMWARIQKQNRKYYEKMRSDTTEAGSLKLLRDLVENSNTFQFSPPIYFRKKSIFIFYFIRLCGSSCGVEELSFYRLENGSYKKWFVLTGGVF